MDNNKKQNEETNEHNVPGNPIYSADEDIYNRAEKTPLGDEDEPIGTEDEAPEEDMGLDVPGADLDDDNEALGEEDEENNYYSLDDQD